MSVSPSTGGRADLPLALNLHAVQTPDDWAQFVALLRHYAETDLDQPQISSIWADIDTPQMRYSAPEGGVCLLRQGLENGSSPGPAIGSAAFAATRVPGLAEIKRVYVRPAHRGQGHARRLTEAAMQSARAAGYAQAGISTWAHNTAALGLYRDLGFAPMAPFKDHPNPDLLYWGIRL